MVYLELENELFFRLKWISLNSLEFWMNFIRFYGEPEEK